MNSSETAQHVIILLGAPGSGKGTQAKAIVGKLKLPHISTGDILRENIRVKSDLGKKAQGYMDSGRLVPDALVLDMLFERVSRQDCMSGYLLDGFPRTIAQAESLGNFLNEQARLQAINLNVRPETIIKRISGRLSCTSCGHIHNSYFSPPKTQGVCDRCGGELIHRADDKPEVVQERLAVYMKQTAPLIDYYENQGILQSVDGEQEAAQVSKEILNLVA